MKITIHGHHFKVSDAVTQYVKEKLDLLASHDHGITSIEVTLILENQICKAEAKIHIPSIDIFASAENDVMYAAIDKLVPKLDRQIRKHKEKHQAR